MANEPPKWNWKPQIIIPVLAIVLSVITSWSTTLYTTRGYFQDRAEQAEQVAAVFANVGYQYFATIINRYDLDTGEFKRGAAAQALYIEGIKDVQRQIRWLRTNSVYLNSVFSFAQQALTAEVVGSESLVAQLHMCNIYMGSQWGKRSASAVNEAVNKDVATFARRLCCERAEEVFTTGTLPDCAVSAEP